jgi:integrase
MLRFPQEATADRHATDPRRARERDDPSRSDEQAAQSQRAEIKMSIGPLAMILDEAVRQPDIDLAANPARDKKLRVKVPKKKVRDWLEPDEVITLLEAAERVDNPVRPETERKAREVRRLRDEERLTIKQIAQQLEMSEGASAGSTPATATGSSRSAERSSRR